VQKSKTSSAEVDSLLNDMNVLLARLDASRFTLAAARLSSAIDAVVDDALDNHAIYRAETNFNVH
jgi:hypothetical protein